MSAMYLAHRRINVGHRGDTFPDHPHCLPKNGRSESICHVPRKLFVHRYRMSADRFVEGAGYRDGFFRAEQLNQWH